MTHLSLTAFRRNLKVFLQIDYAVFIPTLEDGFTGRHTLHAKGVSYLYANMQVRIEILSI